MNHYSEIGQYLRMAREERRVSLPDVAQQLHIRTRYLAALEEGDIAQLPGLPYAKGYLLRYATFLNLDCAEIIRRFEFAQKEAKTPFFFRPQTFSQDKQLPPMVGWFSFMGLLLMFVVWFSFSKPHYGSDKLVQPIPEKVEENPCATAAAALYPPCVPPEQEITVPQLDEPQV